jgi:hypothetical protein
MFEVNASVEDAWNHLALVEQWPSWAAHIKRIDVEPPGSVTASSSGTIHLRGGMKSTFRMTEFHPFDNWKWTGPFLHLTVHYDHRFERVKHSRCKMTWIVQAEGFAAAILGRVFAAIYRRNLSRAIPQLVAELGSRDSTEA